VANLNRQTVIAGAIGNALEWYDFAVFGFFAPIISSQFFPLDEPIAGLLKTFGIFAIGYLARPIGGILLGHLGDRIGRQRVLQISIVVMAIPTTLICVLPTHAEIGVWAAVLLVLLRLVQGCAVGGELVGSICYLVEVAPTGKRGFVGSFAMFSASFGILAGSAIAAILHTALSAEAIADWGWRLPFLGGLVLGFTGWKLRRGLLETPAFREILDRGATVRHPALRAIRQMPRQIFLVGVMVLLLGVGYYILLIWLPTYLTHMVTPSVDHALLINTFALIVLIAIIPLGGRLSDALGYKRAQTTVMIATAILVYPLFVWIDTGGIVAAVGAAVLFAIAFGLLDGFTPIALAAQFPVELRYSGIAVGYNSSLAVFGGTAPLIATWLIKETGDLTSPAWYVAGTALLSCIATLILKGHFEATDTT